MFPIALKLGPIYISSFGMLLAVGFIFSLFIAYQECKDRVDISVEELFDTIFFVVIVALVGARAFFILLHPQEFNNNILLMLLFRERPGLSYIGAILGSGIVLFATLRNKKISFGKLLDTLTGSIAVFILFAQTGALLDGFSFGKTTTLPLGVSVLGESVRRFPLPLFSILGIFLLLMFLNKIKKYSKSHNWGDGAIFTLFVALYSLLSLILNSMRSDGYMIQGISLDVVSNALFAVLAFISLYLITRSFKKDMQGVLAIIGKTLHNIEHKIKRT